MRTYIHIFWNMRVDIMSYDLLGSSRKYLK